MLICLVNSWYFLFSCKVVIYLYWLYCCEVFTVTETILLVSHWTVEFKSKFFQKDPIYKKFIWKMTFLCVILWNGKRLRLWIWQVEWMCCNYTPENIEFDLVFSSKWNSKDTKMWILQFSITFPSLQSTMTIGTYDLVILFFMKRSKNSTELKKNQAVHIRGVHNRIENWVLLVKTSSPGEKQF